MRCVVNVFGSVIFFGAVTLTMLLGPTLADAALVTYQFSGTVTDVSNSLSTPGGHGANGFDIGLKLSGSYTFDTTTPGLSFTFTNHMIPSAGSTTVTSHIGAITSLNVSLGTYAPSATGYNHFNVVTGTTANYNVYHEVAGTPVHGMTPVLFDISLADTTGTAFSGNNLPGTEPPSIASFNSRGWTLGFLNGDSVRGSISTLTAVPLPASIFLFGAGLSTWWALAYAVGYPKSS